MSFGGHTKDPAEVKTPEVAQPVEALAVVEAQRFERIKNLVGMIGTVGPVLGQFQGLLSKIDVSKLPTLLAALEELLGASDLKGRIVAGLKLARIYVAITPGETDNAMLDQIDKLLGNAGLLDTLLGLIKNIPGFGTAGASGTVSALSVESLAVALDNPRVEGEESTGAKFQAAGFSLGAVLGIVKLVTTILEAVGPLLLHKPAPTPAV